MITGIMLKNAVVSASNNIYNNRQNVDALNVFPVPDGDTGTNMSMTFGSSLREISMLPDDSGIDTVSAALASTLLRGARGNSGVILSLIFRGFSNGLKGMEAADGADIANALKLGAESAYKAVMKPTEGTMLTVIRVTAEQAITFSKTNKDAVALWEYVCKCAASALEKTPDQLPTLKKAGVVDAGGKGLLLIFEGMREVFSNNTIIQSKSKDTPEAAVPQKTVVAESEQEIKFAYCTEFIVDRDKTVSIDPLKLRAYLEAIGDCVVVVDDEDIIKVHVHTNDPGNAIQAALEYGPLESIKIDNMKKQHKNANWGVSTEQSGAPETKAPAEPVKEYGFVAVASGSGVASLFRELGADQVVQGGQTMNPSTDHILEAVMATPAKHVFVLPNNKNIIMSAEQVIPLADRGVSVLHTKSIPQGITAMLNFDETISADENHLNMIKAASKIGTGLVTFAARNSTINGKEVKKDQILGLENNSITVVENDIITAAFKVVRHLLKKGDYSFVTLIYGEGVTEEQAKHLENLITAKCGSDIDVSVVDGGQPVYYFIISAE